MFPAVMPTRKSLCLSLPSSLTSGYLYPASGTPLTVCLKGSGRQVRLKRVEGTVSHEHRELLNVTMKILLKMVRASGCPREREKSASGNARGPDTPGCTLLL